MAWNTHETRREPRFPWLRDPVVLLSVLAYTAALIIMLAINPFYDAVALAMLASVLVAGGAAWLLLRRLDVPGPTAVRPGLEVAVAFACAAAFIAVAAVYHAEGREMGDPVRWLLAIGLPLTLIVAARWGRSTVLDSLREAGLRLRGLKSGILAAILVCALIAPVIILQSPLPMYVNRGGLSTPAGLALAFSLGFARALLMGGIPEEFFFRGILQSRLEALLRSPVRALIIASLVFGLAHVPRYFYTGTWWGAANLLYPLAITILIQAVLGLLLGLLWLRTRNLAAPVIVHAFIDAFSLMAF